MSKPDTTGFGRPESSDGGLDDIGLDSVTQTRDHCEDCEGETIHEVELETGSSVQPTITTTCLVCNPGAITEGDSA